MFLYYYYFFVEILLLEGEQYCKIMIVDFEFFKRRCEFCFCVVLQIVKKVIEINLYFFGIMVGGVVDCLFWERLLVK